jgi:hypothetical protein
LFVPWLPWFHYLNLPYNEKDNLFS